MAAAVPIVALISGALALLGLLGAYSGLLAPLTGFQMFAAGALLGGFVTLLLSLVAIVTTRGGRDPVGRKKALLGGGFGVVLLLVVFGAASTGGDAPPINDITTDLDDPPQFAPASVVPDYAGRDMSYPPEFVAIVREHYPDLESIDVPEPPPIAYGEALEVAEMLGWEVVASDPHRLAFDAQAVSALFRFVDDVTVRVVPRNGGSRIDVRSKSRDGRGDLGANAARIRAFAEKMR
jgi:hypothetical protein